MPAVKELRAVTLSERGAITKIHGRAYVAGVLPFKVTRRRAPARLFFAARLMP